MWTATLYACALPFLLLFSRFDAAGMLKIGGLFNLGQLAAIYGVSRLLGFLTSATSTRAAPVPVTRDVVPGT